MHKLAEEIHLPETIKNYLDDVPPIGREFADVDGRFWLSFPGGDHNAVLKYGQWRGAVNSCLETISFADALVGRVLDALEKSPDAENAVIVFLSDQGTHLGEKYHWRKHDLLEESLRVPLIILIPEIRGGKGRCLRTVSLLNINPNLIDICKLAPKKELEGQSLLPLLENPETPWNRSVLSTYGHNNHSIQSERWHYIRYEDGTEELYDHQNDPYEWTNLVVKSCYEDIISKLERWLPEVNAPDAPSKETNIKLRSGSKWEKLR